jgi:DNA-binding transcriptional MerR regulator
MPINIDGKKYYYPKEVADMLQITTRAIKYAESDGRIDKPTKRDSNGYRLYNKEEILKVYYVFYKKVLDKCKKDPEGVDVESLKNAQE